MSSTPSSFKSAIAATTSLSVVLPPVMIAASAPEAQARSQTQLTIAQSLSKRQRDRQLRYQNLKKVTRYPTPAIEAPQSLPPVPARHSPVTYNYAAPGYPMPLGSDRPICFMERSDGTFVDLRAVCGMKENHASSSSIQAFSGNPFGNPSNANLPSYPIYPGDRR